MSVGQVPNGARLSLSGLRAFGDALGVTPPVAVAPPTVVRNSTDPRRALVQWSAVHGAQFYVVRYGLLRERTAAHAYQIYGGACSAQINALSTGETYRFFVDSVNEGGRTEGRAFTVA